MPSVAPYWQKDGEKSKAAEDLAWNFPEQHQGTIKIVGGNASAFSTEVKISEYINKTFPFIKSVKNIFPDALKTKFPPQDNLEFCPSTDTGSFTNSPELRKSLEDADFSILLGDLSKNSVTSIAIAELIKNSNTPTLITRDAIDLVANTANDFINREQLYIIASMASLQKLFRAIYYPRPIMLSQPIFPVVETLHKFSLSYPISILTFHDNKIICAYNGKVVTTEIAKTKFSPLSLWNGELAARLAVFATYNPTAPLESMLAAINYK